MISLRNVFPIILAVPALFFSCAVFEPAVREARPAPETAGTPPAEKAAAPHRTEARTEDLILGEMPPRVGDFLAELKNRMLSHDWEWAVKRADPVHYSHYAVRRRMDDPAYLQLLFRVGEAWARGEVPLAPEPRAFDLARLSAMRYMKTRREGFAWVVQGILIDSRGSSADFTLEVLGDLQEILLAGN